MEKEYIEFFDGKNHIWWEDSGMYVARVLRGGPQTYYKLPANKTPKRDTTTLNIERKPISVIIKDDEYSDLWN